MKYLSIYNAKKKKAADSGVFLEEIAAVNKAKWEIEKTIQQHEDPNALRHSDIPSMQNGMSSQLPAYKPETLSKLKQTLVTLNKATEQLQEVGRLFSYEHEYEEEFQKNFKG